MYNQQFRDNQRSKIYKAEANSKWYWKLKAESTKEFYEFIQLVMENELPNNPYQIKHTKKSGAWFAQRRNLELNFAKHIFQFGVALHEIAHAITKDEDEAHGPQFAYTLLNLVNEYLGASYADELETQFNNQNVCYDFNKKYSKKAADKNWIVKKGNQYAIPITPSIRSCIEMDLEFLQKEFNVSLSKTRLYVPDIVERKDIKEICYFVEQGAFSKKQVKGIHDWEMRIIQELFLQK